MSKLLRPDDLKKIADDADLAKAKEYMARQKKKEEEGWLDRRLLAERLQHRDINQDIHRIREDFQRLALFEDAESIVEDQREQSKVRLGIHDVSLR